MKPKSSRSAGALIFCGCARFAKHALRTFQDVADHGRLIFGSDRIAGLSWTIQAVRTWRVKMPRPRASKTWRLGAPYFETHLWMGTPYVRALDALSASGVLVS